MKQRNLGATAKWVLQLTVPSILTILGLISAWMLFGAQTVTKKLEDERSLVNDQQLAAFQSALQETVQKNMAKYNNEQEAPSLIVYPEFYVNPYDPRAPAIITGTLYVKNVGHATAKNLIIDTTFPRPLAGSVDTVTLRRDVTVDYDSQNTEARITVPTLQERDTVKLVFPLSTRDIVAAGTAIRDLFSPQQVSVSVENGHASLTHLEARAAFAPYYRVKSGDTLASIAAKYGLDVETLKKLNHITTDRIYTGEILVVY